MKIYTKTGDKGLTSLLGGKRVPKHHIRIEAYGTVDELNAWLGLITDSIADQKELSKKLRNIQSILFTLGAALASDPSAKNVVKPDLLEQDIQTIEKEIDQMTATLPDLKNFILPGGSIQASYCQIARCVCRRAERICTQLNESEKLDDVILKYLNRLSDYLFVLSRTLCYRYGGKDIKWNARK